MMTTTKHLNYRLPQKWDGVDQTPIYIRGRRDLYVYHVESNNSRLTAHSQHIE